jgi:hypothetical protein
MDDAGTSGDHPDAESDHGGAQPGDVYEIPSPTRRRTSGLVFLSGALLAIVGVAVGLPAGLLAMAGLLAAIGVFNLLTAWRLTTSAEEALDAASRQVAFPIGHASAVLTFEGWRSRPVWQVMLYSADDPPARRGLVRVDGITGTALGELYEEDVPAPS